jgi:uncharacterized membrane protein YoaK (UPF0700 family)
MTLPKLINSALAFSVISGIMNILGIKLANTVTTNVTGLFSSSIQSWGNSYVFPIALASYIFLYLLGAVWGSWWYSSFHVRPVLWKKLVSPITNLSILLYGVLSQNPPVALLMFAMSNHNAFASNFTNYKIKPSQLTGLVMDMGVDIAKFNFENLSQQRCIKQNFIVRILIIIGFCIGGILAIYYTNWQLIWVAVAFYIALIGAIILGKF